jgi:hypothetical protein
MAKVRSIIWLSLAGILFVCSLAIIYLWRVTSCACCDHFKIGSDKAQVIAELGPPLKEVVMHKEDVGRKYIYIARADQHRVFPNGDKALLLYFSCYGKVHKFFFSPKAKLLMVF